MESYEKFNKLIEVLGKDTVITEILNYFPSDDINEFVDSVANDHDVMIDEDEYVEDMLDTVEQWFIDSCGYDGYFDEETRIEDLTAMSECANDAMVDNCVEYLLDMYNKAEDYRDKIEEKLAELASDEI